MSPGSNRPSRSASAWDGHSTRGHELKRPRRAHPHPSHREPDSTATRKAASRDGTLVNKTPPRAIETAFRAYMLLPQGPFGVALAAEEHDSPTPTAGVDSGGSLI